MNPNKFDSFPGFEQLSPGFYVNHAYCESLAAAGLNNIDSVRNFAAGSELVKDNLAAHRSRTEIQTPDGKTVYLKRYFNTPKIRQLKNRMEHGTSAATAFFDIIHTFELNAAGVNTPEPVAWGFENKGVWESFSFSITAAVPGISLEKQLPACFTKMESQKPGVLKEKKQLLEKLACEVKKFHDTGCRHRDMYLCHIFMDGGQFYFIDLHRTFKPLFFAERYRLKDLTQLYYSAPGEMITRSDRLRFYLSYCGKDKLARRDKLFIKAIKAKAWRIAERDLRHGRGVPFAR